MSIARKRDSGLIGVKMQHKLTVQKNKGDMYKGDM